MKIFDISWPVSEAMTGYKNKKQVKLDVLKEFETDGVRESLITLGSHSGTHVDAPAHFVKDGKAIDHIDLASLIGPCKVIDCTTVSSAITREFLEKITIESNDIILLKTCNSEHAPTDSFDTEFVYLEQSGAAYLVERGIKAVGIDYLGIERLQPHHETHMHFMKADIPIIEGLRLHDVPAGNYFLWCLPLKIMGTEAAPARAILIQDMRY